MKKDSLLGLSSNCPNAGRFEVKGPESELFPSFSSGATLVRSCQVNAVTASFRFMAFKDFAPRFLLGRA